MGESPASAGVCIPWHKPSSPPPHGGHQKAHAAPQARVQDGAQQESLRRQRDV